MAASAPPTAEVRDERQATLLALVDAENRLDLDAITALFPVPRYELIGTNKVYEGIDAVTRYLRERRAAFPDLRIELVTFHHADDALIAEFWLTGTHLGVIEGITPTGRAFRCRMAGFFLFEGTRLTCERIYFDNGTIARQLA
jgi:predicted ester cyclase